MSKTIWIINQYGSLPTEGIGGRHQHLSRELVKLGFDVTLVSGKWSHLLRNEELTINSPEIEYFEGFRFLRVPVLKYKHAHDIKRALNWFLFAWNIRNLTNKLCKKPDIILYSSPSLIGYLAAKRIAKKNNAKLIFEVRDIWPLTLMQIGNYSSSHPFIKFLQWIEDKAYRESDFVISNLKNAFKHMENRGMDSGKFHWIPNGFSLSDITRSKPIKSSVLTKIPKKKFIIGYTGSLGEANALDTLIKAAKKLNKRSDIAFVLVGNGKEKENLKKQKFEYGLNNVIFIDSISKTQISSLLDKFDVCYIGLKKKSLFRYGVSPNKLFDYLINKKPIIYSIDSGDYRPVCEAGAGITIQPENSSEIVKAVLKLKALSKVSLKNMGMKGYDYVLKKHNYSILAKRLAEIILK